jgi:AraC-like DNA-binding protein
MIDRFEVSTAQFPAELDNLQRFLHWRNAAEGPAGAFDLSPTPDRPFKTRSAGFRSGTTSMWRVDGTIKHIGSPRNLLSFIGPDRLMFNSNLGSTGMAITRNRTDVVFEAGQSALCMPASGGLTRVSGDELHLRALVVPRRALCELVSNVDDILDRPLDPRLPAMGFLERYLTIVADPDGFDSDPLVFAHVDRTIVDLLALAIGAGRDATEIAGMRGLRAARAQAVLAEIRAHFAVRSFSPRHVAEKLGLAPRYVQNLLQETGASFSERVLELRLQKARAMLMDPRHNRLRISEIAAASGFNEIPYFNRCFRRRFGASPTALRGESPEQSSIGQA